MNDESGSTNGGATSRETIPTNSFSHERAAAEERKKAFPYRFPRDSRRLGGKYSVKENARRLLRFFYFERCFMHGLGAWTLSVPEFEVKLEMGRHIIYPADAARHLRERLHEQEKGVQEM